MNSTKTVAEKTATKPLAEEKNNKIPAANLPTIEPEKRKDVTKEPPKKSAPNLEEKLNILEELNALVEKRDLIKEALKDVANFYISPSGHCQLKATDSNGKSFSISHPAVIEEVLTQVTFKLEEELDKVETQFELLY